MLDASSCQACGAHFPERDGAYFRICGECWHCWKTEADLLEHHRTAMAACGITPRTSAAEILSCPCCVHDF